MQQTPQTQQTGGAPDSQAPMQPPPPPPPPPPQEAAGGAPPPPTGGAEATPAMYIEYMIRTYWYQALILAGMTYLFVRWLGDKWDEYRSKPKAAYNDADHVQSLEERMAKARKKQQAFSDIAAAQDAEIREEKERVRLEEMKAKQDEIMQRINNKKDGGNQLGGAGATSRPAPAARKPTTAANQNKKKNDSDSDDEGPRKRLPKLSGGSKDEYESFPGQSSNGESGGGRYQRSSRNCGPKGG